MPTSAAIIRPNVAAECDRARVLLGSYRRTALVRVGHLFGFRSSCSPRDCSQEQIFLHPRVAASEQPPQAPRVVSYPQPFMTTDLRAVPSDERPERSLAGSWHLIGNPREIASGPPGSHFTDSEHHSVEFVQDRTGPTRDSTPAADTRQPEPDRKPVPMLTYRSIRPCAAGMALWVGASRSNRPRPQHRCTGSTAEATRPSRSPAVKRSDGVSDPLGRADRSHVRRRLP